MKKKAKITLIVVIVLVLLGVGAYVYFTFFHKTAASDDTGEVIKVTNTIDDYGYTLEDRDTELFKSKFEELKNLLNTENFDQQEYAKLVAELFVIDLYTIDNKISRYDVGGLEYVYPDAVESYKSVAENSIYKTVENNVDGTRTQDLPEVSSINISSCEATTYKMPDGSTVNGYNVKLTWEYVTDLGYDTYATLTVIPNNNKLAVVTLDTK